MWNNFYTIISDDLSVYMHWKMFGMIFIAFELCKFQACLGFFLTFSFEMIVDLWHSCKDSTESIFPFALHPASFNVNILHKHGTFIKIKKLTW